MGRGDGGPLVVLQSTAADHWQGAADFENSLTEGGDVETDYDVICRCDDPPCVIQRHDREMLVLDDSSWNARLFVLPDGVVAVTQFYYAAEDRPNILGRTTLARPARSLALTVMDPALRLLVGDDTGDGRDYGYAEVPVTPGAKRADVYAFDDGTIVLLKER